MYCSSTGRLLLLPDSHGICDLHFNCEKDKDREKEMIRRADEVVFLHSLAVTYWYKNICITRQCAWESPSLYLSLFLRSVHVTWHSPDAVVRALSPLMWWWGIKEHHHLPMPLTKEKEWLHLSLSLSLSFFLSFFLSSLFLSIYPSLSLLLSSFQSIFCLTSHVLMLATCSCGSKVYNLVFELPHIGKWRERLKEDRDSQKNRKLQSI